MGPIRIKVGICMLGTSYVVSEACFNLPDDVAHYEMRSLDYPDSDTDRLTEELFCTPLKVREVVEKNRKAIAAEIANEIVKLFAKDDTVMGYKAGVPSYGR
jgi:hypothetical protein